MSGIFAGLDVKPLKPDIPTSVFDGLDVTPMNPQPTQPEQHGSSEGSWGQFVSRTGKSAVAGAIGGLADTVAAAYNIPAMLTNAANSLNNNNDLEIDPVSGGVIQRTPGERPELPLIPSATDAMDEGIDHITGGYTKTPEQEKWFQEGIRFAAAVASGGGLGSLAGKAGRKGLESGLKVMGTTKPAAIAGAGASGAALQKASEWEASSPAAFGSSIGAGLITEAALKALSSKTIAKRATALSGFGKGNLNVPAIEAANRLNIDLPGVAATKGVVPAFAHQAMGKFPWFGDKLREKVKEASTQYQNAWEAMLDSVGLPKGENVSRNIDRSYEVLRQKIPEGATVAPTPVLDAIADIETQLKAAVPSEPTKKLFSIMGEFKKAFASPSPKLPDGFEKLPQNIQEKVLAALGPTVNPIPVKELVRQKVEINKIMKDRNIFDRHDTDSLGFLHKIRDGIAQTLEDYGKQNPKFLKTLKRAEARFARTAKREALDDALSGKIVDPKTGEVSYNSLLNVLGDRKRQKFLRNNLGETNYKKLAEFAEVAKAMESIRRNNPNPSGSATMGAAIGVIGSLLYGKLAIPAAVIGGGSVATKLLTSKAFLNKATQFAKEPTEPLVRKVAEIVKENTGMTVLALQEVVGKKQGKD